MPQPQGPSSTSGGRLDASIGTALAAGDVALGAGWGATTVAITAGSNAQAGRLTLTCATGGGLAQASATITITFPQGAYNAAPWGYMLTTNDNSIDTGHVATSTTTTTLVGTYSVLPVNTKIYVIDYLVIAKAG